MQPCSAAQVRNESCTFSKELDLGRVVTGDFGLGEVEDFMSLEVSLCVSPPLLQEEALAAFRWDAPEAESPGEVFQKRWKLSRIPASVALGLDFLFDGE